MDEVDNYILALLKVASEEKVEVDDVKLQKVFFLLEKEGGVNLGLEFEPYLFGPFSMKLALARDKLVQEGKIKEKKEAVKDPFFNFTVGHKVSYELGCDCDVNVPKEVEDFFRKWVTKSRREILKYVYEKYPEYGKYELIRDKVIRYDA